MKTFFLQTGNLLQLFPFYSLNPENGYNSRVWIQINCFLLFWWWRKNDHSVIDFVILLPLLSLSLHIHILVYILSSKQSSCLVGNPHPKLFIPSIILSYILSLHPFITRPIDPVSLFVLERTILCSDNKIRENTLQVQTRNVANIEKGKKWTVSMLTKIGNVTHRTEQTMNERVTLHINYYRDAHHNNNRIHTYMYMWAVT